MVDHLAHDFADLVKDTWKRPFTVITTSHAVIFEGTVWNTT